MSITTDTTELKKMFEAKPLFKKASDANISARPDPAVAMHRQIESIKNKAIGKQRELMELMDELYDIDEMAGDELRDLLNNESYMRTEMG